MSDDVSGVSDGVSVDGGDVDGVSDGVSGDVGVDVSGNVVFGGQGPPVSKVTLCVQKWRSPTECRYRAARAVKNLILT